MLLIVLKIHVSQQMQVLNGANTLTSNAKVEMKNSSLKSLEDFSICGRFFSPYMGNFPYLQSLVYIHEMWLFSQVIFLDCDYLYSGCTEYYKKVFGNIYFWAICIFNARVLLRLRSITYMNHPRMNSER